jgi:energy-converting hydrogenase Eha subunit G
MRSNYVYLIVYLVLIAGAGLALWAAGVFRFVPLGALAFAALIAIGIGVLLAVTSERSRIPRG